MIAAMVNTSSGMEPYFAFSYDMQTRIGKHEILVPVYREWGETGSGPLPDHFVTALDLAPEEHVEMQSVVQRWVDSGISKTHNLPEDYTVEQVDKVFRLMHKLGCKGGTVHRQGARKDNVLTLKTDKPGVYVGDFPPQKLRTIPDEDYGRRPGVTYTIESPVGTVHFTLNSLPSDGQPFDCFLRVGKGGHDLEADAEAIGRLISVILRIQSEVGGEEKLRIVYNQLSRIGGSSVPKSTMSDVSVSS